MGLKLIVNGTKQTRAVLALLVAAFFVIAPIGDAFLCAGEAVEQGAALTLSADTATDHSMIPDSDAHCLHGHCHHMVPMAPPIGDLTTANFGSLKFAWVPPLPTSRFPSSLDRPPRV